MFFQLPMQPYIPRPFPFSIPFLNYKSVPLNNSTHLLAFFLFHFIHFLLRNFPFLIQKLLFKPLPFNLSNQISLIAFLIKSTATSLLIIIQHKPFFAFLCHQLPSPFLHFPRQPIASNLQIELTKQ